MHALSACLTGAAIAGIHRPNGQADVPAAANGAHIS